MILGNDQPFFKDQTNKKTTPGTESQDLPALSHKAAAFRGPAAWPLLPAARRLRRFLAAAAAPLGCAGAPTRSPRSPVGFRWVWRSDAAGGGLGPAPSN